MAGWIYCTGCQTRLADKEVAVKINIMPTCVSLNYVACEYLSCVHTQYVASSKSDQKVLGQTTHTTTECCQNTIVSSSELEDFATADSLAANLPIKSPHYYRNDDYFHVIVVQPRPHVHSVEHLNKRIPFNR